MEGKSQTTEVMLRMPNTETLGQLEGLEEEYNMTPRYWSKEDWVMKKDEPIRAVFLGTKEIPNDDGEMVKCGVFATQKEIFLSGMMLLVEAVSRLVDGTPVQITYLGSKKNKSSKGSTNLFEVIKLRV